ncbi:vacuolar-type H+-ATPase subunit F/Vma7 [Streptomyces sp. B4I13]|uniref:V-type ATP synthase subunit F n=1 Tax=Streptomyces sp. B4I13 TaxID=3042271 RepID=UPI002780C6A3|nr:V-type ATP synthase subunit F [Streptomyces sp. B4I13]MDQ0957168.1 vacuolar-type H+-ATPase subunit F/Vma7 [Streptomyces sp. B4I13]
MGRVAAIGEQERVAGFALAGAITLVAEGPEAVREAWRNLPADVELVILTPAAADALGPASSEATTPLSAVMPS